MDHSTTEGGNVGMDHSTTEECVLVWTTVLLRGGGCLHGQHAMSP